jgi:H-type small acid-soluble spore protein
MTPSRAAEIIRSQAKIEVLYKSNTVWIEKVDKEENKARITYLDGGDTVEVAVSQLQEKGEIKG